MGLHISRLEIKNFRNFGHLVLDPIPPRAVIVGENGVGKTNLMHALRLVLDPTLSDANRALRDEDVWDGSPARLADGVVVSIEVELAGYDDDDDAKAVLANSTISYAPYTARLTYRLSPRSHLAVVNNGTEVELTDPTARLTPQDYDYAVYGGGDPTNDVRRLRRDIALRVLPALRDAESDLQNWRRNPLRELLERLPLDPSNLDSTAQAMTLAMDQLSQDANVSRLESHITHRLSEMVGSRLPLSPQLGFASSSPDELIRSVRLFVDSARRRTVADASLGSANVLYLGLLIEALTQQRLDDAFVGSILAVEEPEAHLHVALQRRLFGYLLRSESTLLLTTHSPHVAAVAPIGAIVSLRTTDTGTVGRTTAGLPIEDREAKDLERYLDVTRAEVLFASAVILVEGMAETYIVPAIAEAAGFDLDGYGVALASVGGTDFRPWTTLLGDAGLGIPFAIVTDGDAAPDAAGRTEAGLRRGSRLLPDLNLDDRITQLASIAPLDYTTQRAVLAHELAKQRVFVGGQTLEVDLCLLFPEEIKAAFGEVSSNGPAQSDVSEGVDNEHSQSVDDAVRKKMLGRISEVGKGRFAQRLAAHVEGRCLRAELATMLDLDEMASISGSQLLEVAGIGYILATLDEVSLIVRGHTLFPELVAQDQ